MDTSKDKVKDGGTDALKQSSAFVLLTSTSETSGLHQSHTGQELMDMLREWFAQDAKSMITAKFVIQEIEYVRDIQNMLEVESYGEINTDA